MSYSIDKFTFKKSPNGPLPIFFLSHGGPTLADRNDKFGSNEGAWDKTREVGNYIKNVVKPDFIIYVSAHWQSDFPDKVEVAIPGPKENRFMESNTVSHKLSPDENALIYDFYGFPARHYRNQFHTLANKAIADDIVATVSDSNYFVAQTTERGIDHGCWVPLRVAFGDTEAEDTKKLDIDIPVIQVSLTGTDDINIHYKLGQALAKYRDLNGCLIFSGMSVHNLRDMGKAMNSGKKALDYVDPFNKILTGILTGPSDEVLPKLMKLPQKEEWRTLYRLSHPTNEHFLPVVVGAGASRGDQCKEIYNDAALSLGWGSYIWGKANL
ncbi:DEKNAAC104118 [Brettanomyces naardenensis]|uniref:DEKNAAC104118 n=1 Tax=Brettanomyces naardenensis TaxID=13370 RepID=A0A448YQI0_BRENA|nr:DEKNAAC104118 [Brettanomyces naardenensis]